MKPLTYIVLLLSSATILFFSCHPRHSNSEWIQLADEQASKSTDSLETLLNNVERPLELKGNERLLYGWLSGYLHYKKNASMIEDSLLIPAADTYIANKDSVRELLSYLLKAKYLQWSEKPEEALSVIQEGYRRAEEGNDTSYMQNLLMQEGRLYRFVWHDYKKYTEILRQVIAIKETPILLYSLGLAMALERNDSSAYYMNRSAEFFLQEKDTSQAVFIYRNLANTQAHLGGDQHLVINTARKILVLSEGIKSYDHRGSRDDVMIDSYRSMISAFLHIGKLDSAQHYIDKSWKLIHPDDTYYLMEMNLLTAYQAMVDYTQKGTFDFSKAIVYNDSLCRNRLNQGSTTYQLRNSNKRLTAEALVAMVEKQRTQTTIGIIIVGVLLVGIYVRYRYRQRIARLAEAEERIDTLSRMLEEAQRATDEDDAFVKRMLLQQLGVIRLVANTPTAQNQALLRRLAELGNDQVPVEELIVWEDLYPLIDRLYNGFHAHLMERFGSVLTDKEVQICCLLCAGFSTKEISVITHQSTSSIYVRKTSIRKKLGIEEGADIVETVKNIS